MADSGDVYTGIWRDWEKGLWSRGTITIPSDQAAFLVAFVAIFVGWCGRHLCSILAFTIHQYRCTLDPRDGMFHQEQILLRNVETESHALWVLVELCWSWGWRSQTGGAWRRTTLVAMPWVVLMAGITAMGVLSSKILSLNDTVLVWSHCCGWHADNQLVVDQIYENDDKNLVSDSLYVSGRWTAEKSLEYKSACYEGESSEYSSLCGTYVHPRLSPTSVNRTAECPFGLGACASDALEIDTGLVDSSAHLGINSPAEERVGLRKVMTCALVDVEQYCKGWETWRPTDGPEYGVLNNRAVKHGSWRYYDIFANANFSITYSNESALWQRSGYYIKFGPFFAGESDEARGLSISPLKPELLARGSVDQVLFLLQNLATYTKQVTDPWFKASSQNDSRGYSQLSFRTPNAWYPDAVVSALGCVERYQFCANGRCTALSGLYTQDAGSVATQSLTLSPRQKAVHSVLWKAGWSARVYFPALFLEDRFLLARRFMHVPEKAYSAPVNSDQWVLEVSNLHNLSMATLQRRIVEFARPPEVSIRSGITTRQFVMPPAPEEETICHNVKIRSPAYTSLTLASLLVVVFAGGLVITAGWFLPNLVFWVRSSRAGTGRNDDRATFKTRTWAGDHLFQIHRAALESRGIGPWEPATNNAPVFKNKGERFPLVDMMPTITELSEMGKVARDTR